MRRRHAALFLSTTLALSLAPATHAAESPGTPGALGTLGPPGILGTPGIPGAPGAPGTDTRPHGGTGAAAACGTGTYAAEVTLSGGTWTATRGGTTVYTGGDMATAVQTAINRLTAGRTSMERVVVRGSGSVPASTRISLASHTSLDVCGTINVTGSGSGDMAPIYARGVRNVEVLNLALTGTPQYGIFMRSVDDIHLGKIDMRLSSGLGIRIDNHANKSVKARNVRIDEVYVQGATNHGVETYGVDGLTVGTVTARNVGYSGLILNDTINATVGTVDGNNVGTGTGYAVFRMANRNGRVGDAYPANIRVGNVIARGGGRGIFCVSESGGAVIDRVDISGTGNNAILVENCYNVTIAGTSGTISGGGEIRIASRSEFPVSSGVTFQNLTISNNKITESPCGTGTVVRNNRLSGGTLNVCSGSNKGNTGG